ncbi:MOSC domain-containing protein [Pluralibacter gergoviae]|uniref:MOSC domain-containing protein n=1 Tax=Pluralibacter gergoviae TaxID=61647 RepID=UPI000650DCD9|nr:MOSC domain-containing protein [Pluralibacter gergoviae]ELO7479673.1 MOSC domain-containing protein [Pluralibacter gergoviae]ELW9441690.1 MOSC domain-containing protein [Pluralibacter gergoviae]KMK10781.1 sulfurase [Pluralibacter gergoviae]
MGSDEPVILQTILGNVLQADGSQQKVALTGRVYLGTHGLETESGIKEHFSDTDCALMHYAREHYDFWRERYPARCGLPLQTGIFGENFSTLGMTEESVCPGDVFRLGGAEIQVSWGRVACQTMATRLQDPNAPELMHQQSRNGWFYRVLTPGETACGDVFRLIERPAPGWPLSRVQQIIFNEGGSREALIALSSMPFLASVWRMQALMRLEHIGRGEGGGGPNH